MRKCVCQCVRVGQREPGARAATHAVLTEEGTKGECRRVAGEKEEEDGRRDDGKVLLAERVRVVRHGVLHQAATDVVAQTAHELARKLEGRGQAVTFPGELVAFRLGFFEPFGNNRGRHGGHAVVLMGLTPAARGRAVR